MADLASTTRRLSIHVHERLVHQVAVVVAHLRKGRPSLFPPVHTVADVSEIARYALAARSREVPQNDFPRLAPAVASTAGSGLQ